jgi:general secretion pathway protein C
VKHSIPSLGQLLQAPTLDRAALVAAAALALLLGQALASLTWSVLPQPEATVPPPSNVTAAARPAGAPDYQRVAQMSLFGRARADAVAQAPVEAPDTRLNLTLRGILFNTNESGARAIIASPGKPEKPYQVRDQVSPGVTIDRIFADRVILLREGQHETLRLPENRLAAAAQRPQAAARGATRRGAPAAAPRDSGTAAALGHYRRQLRDAPEQATQFLRAEPVNRDGGLAGFRISPGMDTRLFEFAGLEEGDVVTSVNGIQLDQLDKGFEALEELGQANQLTLTVLRGGQQQTIQLQLQD